MTEVLAGAVARQSFNMVLLSIFAGVALVLAAIGIYGLMSYSVDQRRQEIGIRMALGADRGRMLRVVLREGMTLAVLGVVLGLLLAYGMTRLLASLLFRSSFLETDFSQQCVEARIAPEGIVVGPAEDPGDQEGRPGFVRAVQPRERLVFLAEAGVD